MVSSIGSGTTTLALRSLTATTTRPSAPDPQEMFNRLDADGDGKVTLAELQAGAPPARPGEDGGGKAGESGGGSGEGSAERMLSDLDTDGDGVVSWEEFAARRPAEPPSGPPPGLTAAGDAELSALFGTNTRDDGESPTRLA